MRDSDPGYDVTVMTPAAEQPVTLAEAKAHLRVLHSDEDALIGRYIKAATAHVETVTGRALVIRTLKMQVDGFPSDWRAGLRLINAPIAAVSGITYRDMAGSTQTLAADDYYLCRTLTGAAIYLKSGKAWPQTGDGKRAVTVTYTAGVAATAADLGAAVEDLRNAILLLTEHFFYHRSAVAEGTLSVVPMAVDALIGPHRTHGWL